MTVLYTNKQKLVKTFKRAFNPTTIVIDNKPDRVYVNGHVIRKDGDLWIASDKTVFNYRKSAIGYTLTKLRNDSHLGSEIIHLDNKVQKYTDDIFWYNTLYRKNNKFHLLCRLEEANFKRTALISELDDKLKSIKIA